MLPSEKLLSNPQRMYSSSGSSPVRLPSRASAIISTGKINEVLWDHSQQLQEWQAELRTGQPCRKKLRVLAMPDFPESSKTCSLHIPGHWDEGRNTIPLTSQLLPSGPAAIQTWEGGGNPSAVRLQETETNRGLCVNLAVSLKDSRWMQNPTAPRRAYHGGNSSILLLPESKEIFFKARITSGHLPPTPPNSFTNSSSSSWYSRAKKRTRTKPSQISLSVHFS